jgi:hypothetical protein
MATPKSILEQYHVADLIEWHEKKQLTLNPNFQRRSVWTPDGKSYLIDTLLRGFSMPKIYMRTVIDVETQRSVRDIVDGQQRTRAIIDFAKGRLRLNKRAGEYVGLHYSDLDEDTKQAFLSYPVSVEQLINATDKDVLEVFARLNSYTVPLNSQELRNARYQGDFKWKVREVALELGDFWAKYQVLTTRDRLRMLDDELTAEMFGVILDGVRGKGAINKLYDRNDREFPQADEVKGRVLTTLRFIWTEFDEAMRGEFWPRPTQTLILFAAVAHALGGIPVGDIGAEMPEVAPGVALDPEKARSNLAVLADAASQPTPPTRFLDFVKASSASTHRIASRRARFLHVWTALTGEL